jgi:hypothetical protein
MTEAPISLYFDVPKGQHADLEVVARATIEWIEAIRDLASVVAPGLEYEIEFVESEEGSLWLSNLIKAVKEGDRKALASIVGAVVLFFAMGPALHLQEDAGDEFWKRLGHEDDVKISEDDKREIVANVVKAIEQTQVVDRRRQFIRQVERDPRIGGVGVGLRPSPAGPIANIPREMFPAYGAGESVVKPLPKKDTEVRENVRVKIIRASLKEGDIKPRWRFSEGDPEWSADIEDEEFVAALNADQTGLHLAVGQVMIVDVAIDRRLIDDAWQEDNRRIVRVKDPHISRRQASLDLRGQ